LRKRATDIEIERWKQHYWQLRATLSNKEMAEKTGVDAGNLSAMAKGTKTPGDKFIKDFYLVYPPLNNLANDHQPNFTTMAKNTQYKQGDEKVNKAEEALLRFINMEDPDVMRYELIQRRKSEEYLREELSKVNSTSMVAVSAFDKMAESTVILSREVAYYRERGTTGGRKKGKE